MLTFCGFCGAQGSCDCQAVEAWLAKAESKADVREVRSHLLDVAITAAELGGVTADTLARASAALRERAS